MCGVTNIEDAIEAIDAGVDALGFIFVEKSPRYIAPEQAKEIVSQLPPLISFVGVFVDQDPVEVMEIIEYCGLSYVQLHGNEDPDYCEKLSHTASPCKIIKAFRVGTGSREADFSPYQECVTGYLLDTYVEGQEGGTGRSFDWTIIESLDLRCPVILAGGLTPENVVEALQVVHPFAIDINSGVEEQPGKKDYTKLHALLEQVRISGL